MSATARVIPVSSRRQLGRFVDLPYALYRDNPYYVPQLRMDQLNVLNPKKNPFFQHGKIQCFLAEDTDGNVLGRIAGIVNGMHLQKYDDGIGFFGFFECVERTDVATALLDAASEWLREQGMTGVRGPTNPSMNDVAGLLVDGFDRRPSIMMAYNPPYYEEFLVDYGFERAMTMWAYFIHQKYARYDRMRRGVEIVRKRNPDARLRTLDMSRFEEEAKTILDIYNRAWSANWGHVPMTDAEFQHLAREMKQIVDPRIVFIIEKDGIPVAFSISLPDMNQALAAIRNGRLLPFGLLRLLVHAKVAGINECRTILMGVLPEHRHRGYDVLLNGEIMERGPELGYAGSEMSWLLEVNRPMMNTAIGLGGVPDKEYAMFERKL